jgi:hypothetical protein
MKSIFDNRTYRAGSVSRDLVAFTATVKETNIYVQAERDLTDEAYTAVINARSAVERYIESHPYFATSLVPVIEDPYAPSVVKEMIRDSRLAGVGPMAAVAGAVAQFVALELSEHSSEIIVENGGDIFLFSKNIRVVELYTDAAGPGLGIEIGDASGGLGISSSSAVIGRSLSLGGSDLATVVASTGALSDAAATALGNRATKRHDIEAALMEVIAIPGVLGAVVIVDGKIGVSGALKLIALSS